jgi:hypothetical protein
MYPCKATAIAQVEDRTAMNTNSSPLLIPLLDLLYSCMTQKRLPQCEIDPLRLDRMSITGAKPSMG